MDTGNIGPASIKTIKFKTDAGDSYRITLTNDALNYYKNEELISVRDIGPNYDSKNLYEAAVKIAAKYGVPKEKLVIVQ